MPYSNTDSTTTVHFSSLEAEMLDIRGSVRLPHGVFEGQVITPVFPDAGGEVVVHTYLSRLAINL